MCFTSKCITNEIFAWMVCDLCSETCLWSNTAFPLYFKELINKCRLYLNVIGQECHERVHITYLYIVFLRGRCESVFLVFTEHTQISVCVFRIFQPLNKSWFDKLWQWPRAPHLFVLLSDAVSVNKMVQMLDQHCIHSLSAKLFIVIKLHTFNFCPAQSI